MQDLLDFEEEKEKKNDKFPYKETLITIVLQAFFITLTTQFKAGNLIKILIFYSSFIYGIIYLTKTYKNYYTSRYSPSYLVGGIYALSALVYLTINSFIKFDIILLFYHLPSSIIFGIFMALIANVVMSFLVKNNRGLSIVILIVFMAIMGNIVRYYY